MLKEVKNVSQNPGEPRRRWFDDEFFDLIIWFGPGEEIWGFQLCYDRENKPRALTWTRQYGYRHDGIDTGEYVWGSTINTPVLTADGTFDAVLIPDMLETAAAEIPHAVASLVLKKAREYRP